MKAFPDPDKRVLGYLPSQLFFSHHPEAEAEDAVDVSVVEGPEGLLISFPRPLHQFEISQNEELS